MAAVTAVPSVSSAVPGAPGAREQPGDTLPDDCPRGRGRRNSKLFSSTSGYPSIYKRDLGRTSRPAGRVSAWTRLRVGCLRGLALRVGCLRGLILRVGCLRGLRRDGGCAGPPMSEGCQREAPSLFFYPWRRPVLCEFGGGGDGLAVSAWLRRCSKRQAEKARTSP